MTLESIQSKLFARRNFFTTSALTLGAGAAAISLAPQSVEAQTTATPPTDLQILNYALGLEHLEAAFYNQGLTRFTATDFTNANFNPLVGTLIGAKAFDNLRAIRDHENAHVEALRTAIRGLSGVPVDPCQYNFAFTTFDNFLTTAALLENTGVMAYDGVLGMVQNPGLRTAGAAIATVEARHAAFLNLITQAIPFPTAVDSTKTMQEIMAAIAPFITSCAQTPGGGGGGAATTKAVAGPKNTSTVQKSINLDGSASTSADGKALTYSWRLVSGVAALTGATTATPSVQFGSGGPYTFELTVTDSAGTKATDTVTIDYFGR